MTRYKWSPCMNVNPVLGFTEYFNLVDKTDYKKSIAYLT